MGLHGLFGLSHAPGWVRIQRQFGDSIQERHPHFLQLVTCFPTSRLGVNACVDTRSPPNLAIL
jgi:hypothetical protein